METMPELQEIKSEIGGVDFGAHGGSASTTPQPHQNFQWVSCIFFYHQRFPTSWWSENACGLFCSCKTAKTSGFWESNLFIIHHRQSLIYRDAAVLMSSLPPQTITRRRREKSSKLQNSDNAPKYEATCKIEMSLADIFERQPNHYFFMSLKDFSPFWDPLVQDESLPSFQLNDCPSLVSLWRQLHPMHLLFKVSSSTDSRNKTRYTPYDVTMRVSFIEQIWAL